MKILKAITISIIFLYVSTNVYSQINENTSLQIYPTFNLGLGNSQIVDLGATIGGGANLKIQHLFDPLPFLFIEGDISIAAIPYPGSNLTLLGAGIGAGVNLKLANRMSKKITCFFIDNFN